MCVIQEVFSEKFTERLSKGGALPYRWVFLEGIGGYWWVLVGIGGYWWVLVGYWWGIGVTILLSTRYLIGSRLSHG